MLSDRSDFDCRSYVLLSTQHVVDDPQSWFPSAGGGELLNGIALYLPTAAPGLFPFSQLSPLGSFPPAELELSPWLGIYGNERKKINCLLIEHMRLLDPGDRVAGGDHLTSFAGP